MCAIVSCFGFTDCGLAMFVNSVVLIDSLWYCVLLFADGLLVFDVLILFCCWLCLLLGCGVYYYCCVVVGVVLLTLSINLVCCWVGWLSAVMVFMVAICACWFAVVAVT